MKRHFYLFLLLLAVPLPGRGQVLFSENFEYFQQNNFTPPWGVSGNPGSYPWMNGVSYIIGSLCFPFIGNDTRVAGISDIVNFPGQPCSADHNDSNVLLMTPYINLSNVSNAFLRYDSWFSKKTINGMSERATVEISTDSGAHWTVLAEAPVATASKMNTAYVSLAAYSQQSIRLGFRYRDSAQHMTGWMIDNLKVYVPADHDLSLTEGLPADSMLSYVKPGTSISLGGTVQNAGAQPVTSFNVSYWEGNGPVYTETVTGVNIPPYQTHTFYLVNPFSVTANGRFGLKMWVTLAGDANHANDSGHVVIHGVPFIPDKQVVIEHGTGTWYPFAPQGHVLMRQLRNTDYPVALVALHDQDPMFLDTTYVKYVEHMRLNYIPFFFYDRRNKVEPEVIVALPPSAGPSVGVYNIFDGAAVMAQFDRMRQYFGFANLILRPTLTGNMLTLDVNLTPAVDLPGIHRLALVLTEHGVSGNQSGYAQLNAFSNNAFGAMGGYEALPNPVPASSMVFDFVGRKAAPAPEGAAGSLPPNLYTNNQYTYTFQTTIDPAWTRKNMQAIVMLIRDTDSTILNSATVGIPALGVDEQLTAAHFAQVYPNPADQSANLLLHLTTDAPVTLTVTDITGRLIWQSDRGRLSAGDHNIPFRTDLWASGMYLLQVQAGQSRQTLKVDVVH